MKLSEIPRLLNPTAWAVSAGLALVIGLLAWWLLIGGPAHDRRAAAVGRVETALSGARADSAAEAAAIQDQAHAAATESEALSRETADAILAAPGAGQRLDPGLNDTARRRLCERSAYMGRPECLQFADRPQP